MRSAKADRNQAAIVDALRKAGASVISLHRVGGGVPDLLCGYAGLTVLIEIKAGPTQKLNAVQAGWHAAWRGFPVRTCYSVEGAIDMLCALRVAKWTQDKPEQGRRWPGAHA